MSTPIMNLLDQIDASNKALGDIAEARRLLKNYQSERQRYAALITEVQADIDAKVTGANAQLKALRDALVAAGLGS